MQVSFVDHVWTDDQSIFASRGYLESLAANPGVERYGWIGGGVGNLRFVLPYILQRKMMFRYAQFQSATICLAPATPAEEKEFLNSVADFLRDEAVDFIIQPTVNALFRSYPDGAEHVPYGSFVLDLTRTEEELWNSVHIHHRRSIREAMRSNLRVSQDRGHLDQAHRLIEETMGRSGLETGGRDGLAALVSGLGDRVRVLTAWKDDECQSCAVIPFSHYGASYLYGGRVAHSNKGAHSLLHWEAIRYFKRLGVSRYDFHGARINPTPGSKQDGIQQFKVRFGSRLETGHLWKLPLRRLKHFAFGCALKAKSWMQGRTVIGDIIDQERARMQSAE